MGTTAALDHHQGACEQAAADSAPGPAPEQIDPTIRRWVLIATILASSMVFIDASVVNVALPALQAEFDATAATTLWVVEAYALFLAALILAGGAMGDRYGRLRLFIIGTALFAATSVWCGLAQDANQLIVARAAQGIAGALLTPASLALITAVYPDGPERGRAIGSWSGFTAITSAFGPVLGGFLVEQASWRWIFFLNIPLAAIVLVIALRRMPESRDPSAKRLDWAGATLATLGLGGIVFGLIEAQVRGWTDGLVVGSLVVGVVAFAAFLVTQARVKAPMMPLGLFRSRTFSGANLLTLLLYGALGGALYFLPFMLIQVQGYSATQAGAALAPFVVLMFVLARWAGGLIERFGARLPLVVGPTIAGVGFLLFIPADIGQSYWTAYLPAVLVLGLGMAITVPPLTTAVLGAVDASRAGVASGVNNAVARTASLLAIAVFGIAVTTAFDARLGARLDDLALPGEARTAVEAQSDDLAAAQPPADLPDDQRAAINGAIDRSFLDGFRVAMGLGAALGFGSAIAAGLMIEGRPRRPDQAGG